MSTPPHHPTEEETPPDKHDSGSIPMNPNHTNPSNPELEITIKPSAEIYKFKLLAFPFKDNSEYLHFKNQPADKRELPSGKNLSQDIDYKEALEIIHNLEYDKENEYLKRFINAFTHNNSDIPGWGICLVMTNSQDKSQTIDWIVGFGKEKELPPPSPEDKEKIIKTIQDYILELKKLYPEDGDFWDKDKKAGIVRNIIVQLNKLSPILTNEKDKNLISKYIYKINQFADNLPKMSGSQAHQYKGNTAKIIDSVNYILKHYTG